MVRHHHPSKGSEVLHGDRGTFLQMDHVEHTFGKKGVTVTDVIHKKREGLI
jgi:hypothetical protein